MKLWGWNWYWCQTWGTTIITNLKSIIRDFCYLLSPLKMGSQSYFQTWGSFQATYVQKELQRVDLHLEYHHQLIDLLLFSVREIILPTVKLEFSLHSNKENNLKDYIRSTFSWQDQKFQLLSPYLCGNSTKISSSTNLPQQISYLRILFVPLKSSE